MIKLGLIGFPVSHSLSPKIQNAALKACGLEGEYSLFPIAPDDMQALKVLLDRVRSGEITELNVQTFQGSNVQLIVNTTPLGMTPNIETSPLPENMVLPSRINVYDLVYNPRETKLVRDARAQGLSASTGLGMLIEQAALGFELWTGYKLSNEIFRNAIE